MPQNIILSRPNQVMPLGPMIAFSEAIERPARLDENYAYGESTRTPLTVNARRVFRVARALSANDAVTLETFYRNTINRPFWFYNLRETQPVGSWDPTGANPVGRYCVTWEGTLVETVLPGARTVQVEYMLREVAY